MLSTSSFLGNGFCAQHDPSYYPPRGGLSAKRNSGLDLGEHLEELWNVLNFSLFAAKIGKTPLSLLTCLACPVFNSFSLRGVWLLDSGKWSDFVSSRNSLHWWCVGAFGGGECGGWGLKNSKASLHPRPNAPVFRQVGPLARPPGDSTESSRG